MNFSLQIKKHCSLANPILIYRLPPTSLPVSTPNTNHHSRLTVCLPDSLDLDRCLMILFWLSACEYAGSRDFAFVDALEIWSLRLRLRLRILLYPLNRPFLYLCANNCMAMRLVQ